jgi:uncharacterized membrane protein YfcA
VDTETLIYIGTVFVIAGFVKGFSGLGFSAISIGILATFLDLAVAIPLVVIPSFASSVLVMIEAGGFTSALRKFWPLYIAALPGLAIGIWLLVRPETNIAKSVLGSLLLLYAAWGLLNPTLALSPRLRTVLQGPVGFFTGFFSGLTGVAVMPVSPYLLSLNLPPNLFVQALNISFIISSSVLMLSLGGLGYIGSQSLLLSLGAIIPVALAVKYGSLLRRHVSEKHFRIGVLFVMLFLGANLVIFT